MTKLAAILDRIDSGSVLLPQFQRGYVWNRGQVCDLIRSLYLGYPAGTLLTWETRAGASLTCGVPALRVFLLDGKQRITTLYGIIRGRPPAFFQGDEKVLSGLRFHVGTETFEFYAPARMGDDPRWIDVTSLYTRGLGHQIGELNAHPGTRPRIACYAERLARLWQVLDRDFHEERVTGDDKSIDVVLDISNRVNSSGTKLSKGDLVLAKKCVQWPDALAVMRTYLAGWEKEGFSCTLDWLLRNMCAVATGRAEFSALDNVQISDFQRALDATAGYINEFLDIVAVQLEIDGNRVLMGRRAFPVICRLLQRGGGRFTDSAETSRALYWYIHSALWGRHAGSTETVVNQDCDTASRSGVSGLIGSLERWHGGRLAIDERDFTGAGRGSRFYPLLYLLTRVRGGRDFGTGLPARGQLAGGHADAQPNHIFPKAALYAAGYGKREVNSLANLCFLARETSLVIGKREPEEYCAAVEARYPGALASQWIPRDPALWRIDRYPDFLAARRKLLAAVANEFLAQLRGDQVVALVAELAGLGCADPAVDCEVPDPATGEVLAIAEACWPEGLRPGQGNPVILRLDPAEAALARLRELGYEVFTSADALRTHARRQTRDAAEPPLHAWDAGTAVPGTRM
ncbi:MAG: GmrSD restriction endonuclease domain-containing protein [Trebonia sp.]